MLNFNQLAAEFGGINGKLVKGKDAYQAKTVMDMVKTIQENISTTIEALQSYNGQKGFKSPMARKVRNGIEVKVGYGSRNEKLSDDLVEIIDESWAREEPIPPHHIYVKIAHHLAQEARAGLSDFKIPKDFGNRLLEFQTAAIKIAAHHLNKRGGVVIGDVVGLGKTLMATALARIFEDDQGVETLILCPKNLVSMWEDYRELYRMRARVLSISRVQTALPELRRYRLIIIDESQNLRNRESKRYKAIQEYIQENDSRCILLSATPYNKTYIDLSNQLRLFVPENMDLGIRPECLLREIGETEFIRQHQAPVRSIAAFEQSYHADDWRELMRLYMVRRTRSFIKDNYAETDSATGRKYLTFEDGTHSFFPDRAPRTINFKVDQNDAADQYAQLFRDEVVDIIDGLELSRYGLANYIAPTPHEPPTPKETEALNDLSRAGKRLKGFCRTNLFKRLESSGHSFLLSVERHILRNFIFLHAIENDQPLPIGTTDVGLLDTQSSDVDADDVAVVGDMFEDEEENNGPNATISNHNEENFLDKAAEVYNIYATKYKRRFRWLSPSLFVEDLTKDLESDARSLLSLLQNFGVWNPSKDEKLNSLIDLLIDKHPDEKVIIFTQFADSVSYLETHLKKAGLSRVSGVSGDSPDPTKLAWRFSPVSNEKRDRISEEDELRVLVATDVLSEGQNLQDCAIVVNYDLPWAIIRLIQRAGRVDRIGQQSEEIICYSFLPAEGIENIIRLRSRVRQRLHENAEVVGTDEAFFENEDQRAVLDLYNERTGILDGDTESEIDLASFAYQIWKNAINDDPKLEKIIEGMPSVVYSSKSHQAEKHKPNGVLIYMRTGQENDALAWIDQDGNSVTESQYDVLRAAECSPETPAVPRQESHHELVLKGAEFIAQEEAQTGGQLGRPSGARFRAYERLKTYAASVEETLFDTVELKRTIDDIYRYPLRGSATDTLNRQLRSGISDETLAELVIGLRADDRLCVFHEEHDRQEPRIICSLGLVQVEGG